MWWFSQWRIRIDLRKTSHRLNQALSRRIPRENEENLEKSVRIDGIQTHTLTERYSVTPYTNLLGSPPKYLWDKWHDTRNSVNEDSANPDTPLHVSGSLHYWQKSVAYREGGFGGFTPSPKFRSFNKADPNSLFRGKYIRNRLVFLFHHPN
jgi:hypothetical protein